MEKDMLFSGESVNVEYKVAVPKDSAKYMKTVVAYANGRGGKIIFGVDDNAGSGGHGYGQHLPDD